MNAVQLASGVLSTLLLSHPLFLDKDVGKFDSAGSEAIVEVTSAVVRVFDGVDDGVPYSELRLQVPSVEEVVPALLDVPLDSRLKPAAREAILTHRFLLDYVEDPERDAACEGLIESLERLTEDLQRYAEGGS